jgi:cysteine desulfurase
VGLAAALELVAAERRAGSVDEMAARRNRLEEALLAVEGVSLSSADAPRLSSHCHVTVEGLRSEELLVLLDSAGVCASAGAACASGAPRPSHVLLAMGRDRAGARSGLRFSLATTTSDEEVDRAAMAVVAAIRQLRS